MLWQDIVLDKWITKKELQNALSFALDVGADEVIISAEIADINRIAGTTKVFCHTFRVNGNHPVKTRFLVYLLNTNSPINELESLSMLSQYLQCNVFIGDYSNDPYCYIQIGSVKHGMEYVDDCLIEQELE